jgi:hypothetical protein
MKTSDKLLISLLMVGLLTLVGSTMALKAEYDTIDFNDPFYGFLSTPVKPFSILKIEGVKQGPSLSGVASIGSVGGLPNLGDSYTTVGIQAGKTFEIRIHKDNKIPFTHRSVGDTLIIRYEPDFYAGRINADDAFSATSFAYIIAPSSSIQMLSATGATCKLSGLAVDKLAITTNHARVLISKSTIERLTAMGQRGSLLQTAATNRISTATITSHDSTGFTAERDIFGSLALQNDSTAILKVPASLLKKL